MSNSILGGCRLFPSWSSLPLVLYFPPQAVHLNGLEPLGRVHASDHLEVLVQRVNLDSVLLFKWLPLRVNNVSVGKVTPQEVVISPYHQLTTMLTEIISSIWFGVDTAQPGVRTQWESIASFSIAALGPSIIRPQVAQVPVISIRMY